ncbi:hypothetical protein E7V67_011690 [[Empedobacter] haloabium]|uniref:Uncharacterized protein n=1 Tax=[Empedobacter] haloabium TaxID=592317 RepID=A0ABZ1USN2_9BURK
MHLDLTGYDIIDPITTKITMKHPIDFSIFDSPSGAYGNVTGEVEFTQVPKVGIEVALPGKFCSLKITHLTELDGATLIGLEDVVFDSHAAAAAFAERLESEAGMFCVRYDEL